jgi:hypothetical protein
MAKKQPLRPKLRVVYDHAEIKGWLRVNDEDVPWVVPLEDYDSHIEFDQAMSASKMKSYVRPIFPSDGPFLHPSKTAYVWVKDIRKGLKSKEGISILDTRLIENKDS